MIELLLLGIGALVGACLMWRLQVRARRREEAEVTAVLAGMDANWSRLRAHLAADHTEAWASLLGADVVLEEETP